MFSALTYSAKEIVFSIMAIFLSVNIANASETRINLTPQEKAYLQKTDTIKMCVDPDWAPFERINEQGRHEGIAADLVQLVAQRVGLRIELYPVKN